MTKDLSDDLSALFGGTPATPRMLPQTERAQAIREVAAQTFAENCRKCGGSGNWRPGYPCFACKGKGKLEFKTSPEVRAKARQGAADRAVKKADANWNGFAAAHPAEAAWIMANTDFDFAISMGEAVQKWGDLTEKQLAAVRRCVARSAERLAAKQARKDAAPTVDTARIEAAFATARQAAAADREGLKWLRLRLDTFVFSDAPANGQWAAAIFVKEGEAKLGRITGGKLFCNAGTTDAQRARILAAIADPATAAKAYGQRTGSCSVCGRELTNAESRKLGIGPICAEKYGF